MGPLVLEHGLHPGRALKGVNPAPMHLRASPARGGSCLPCGLGPFCGQSSCLGGARPRANLDLCGQFGALPDGALGVELGGEVGASDEVDLLAGRLQGG